MNVHGSAVTGIDGYGSDGAIIASVLAKGLLFDDIDAATRQTTASIPAYSRSGACFTHVRITLDATSGTKLLEFTQAGDVHVLVLDTQGTLVRESADEDLASSLVRAGAITEDEGLYHHGKAVVTNSIGGTYVPTRSPSIPLQPGYRVIVASDGVFDNLTTKEFLQAITGRDARNIIVRTEELVIPRMKDFRSIRDATPERAKARQYSDGYRSAPKPDNMSIAVIDIC